MRHRCPGIVLRRWPYSENSQVLRVLTPDQGAVSLMAKGVNRLKSGQLGVFDTWSLVEVEFGGKEGAEMLTLYRGNLLDRMSGLSQDTRRLAAAGILAELAELGSPPGQPAPRLFLWLQKWLQRLAAGASVDPLLVAALMEGLMELGLCPELELPKDVPAATTLWFSPASGGLTHTLDGRRPEQHARRLAPGELNLLRSLQADPEFQVPPSCEDVVGCLTILGDFLHYHLERPPKAWQVLQREGVHPVPGP